MSNILLINAKKAFGHSGGRLNTTLQQAAAEFLSAKGHQIKETIIEDGYDNEEEIQKILWADVVIYQFPGWWMAPPWILKKYMDDVFTAGSGILYANDGRTRSDSSRKYGSGGLLQGKKYMLSSTWNAPVEAFDDPGQFFMGKGIDGVLLPVHKANQFLGMAPLPSFLATDVMKEPHVEEVIAQYKAHLDSHL